MKRTAKNLPVFQTLALALLTAFNSGCQPAGESDSAQLDSAQPTSVSDVPLRVVVAGQADDVTLFERQWLAGSDQPIEVSVISPMDFLQTENVDGDVVLFPARFLGDMVRHGWIAKLPEAVLASDAADDIPVAGSAAAQAQTRVGPDQYAISLGCSLPSVLANEALLSKLENSDQGERQFTWTELLELLAPGQAETAADASADAVTETNTDVDREALVDRFLAIAGGLNERNTKYGILFEMQTMSSRLEEPEFVEAANVLKSLYDLPGGPASVLGSHENAWLSIVGLENPMLVIANPAEFRTAGMKITEGAPLRIATLSNTKGWNTGGGMLASIAADCRQSSRSVALLKWLGRTQTRSALAPVIVGVEPTSPSQGANSSAWLALQQLRAIQAGGSLPQEPSLPFATDYRQSLAEELLQFLAGDESAAKALSDAHRRWNEITLEAGATQRTDYERSLGLTL